MTLVHHPLHRVPILVADVTDVAGNAVGAGQAVHVRAPRAVLCRWPWRFIEPSRTC